MEEDPREALERIQNSIESVRFEEPDGDRSNWVMMMRLHNAKGYLFQIDLTDEEFDPDETLLETRIMRISVQDDNDHSIQGICAQQCFPPGFQYSFTRLDDGIIKAMTMGYYCAIHFVAGRLGNKPGFLAEIQPVLENMVAQREASQGDED